MTADFSFLIQPNSEPEQDYPDPERGQSNVIFKLTKHDGLQAISFDGGDAYWDQEASVLDYQIEGLLPDNLRPGWYVIEGYEVDWSRDYYGEVDGAASCKDDQPRAAGFKDFEKLSWLEDKAPAIVKLLAFLNVPMPAWWPEP